MKPVYLFVAPFFPSPESWRGAYCYDFVRALMRTGRYDVRVFAAGEGADYDYQGVHVCRFRTWSLPSAVFPLLFARRNVRSFIACVRRSGIRLEDVAVCHASPIYGLAIKSFNPRCLTVLHHHCPSSFGLSLGRLRHFWVHKAINFFLYRNLYERIDLHVFISAVAENSFRRFPDTSWTVYDDYRRLGRGLGFFRPARLRDSVILWNGVDTRQFFPRGEGRDPVFTMGCIANFIDLKDQLTLLRAVERVRDKLGAWRLRLVGSGPLLGQCRDFVREHGLEANVTFEKEVDHTCLPDFYRSLDLFVLPSYFEGFGCVFTEAWACGVPFITCEGQGMDDLIPGEERALWLCKPKAPEDLAAKILHFYIHRPQQHLSGPVDIDVLVPRFVDQVETLRKAHRLAN